MSQMIEYVARIKDIKTGKIIEEKLIQKTKLKHANDFQELGLRHREQLDLIKAGQDFVLKYQCHLFSDIKHCPKCNKLLRKQGVIGSDLHDIFTDHRVNISRLTCTCGWKNKNTINAIYGSATHPELLKMQVTTAAEHSFKKASMILNTICVEPRKINNDVTLMRHVGKVGTLLDVEKKSDNWCDTKERASELIVTTDVGMFKIMR